MNPLFGAIEKLINEHGSAAILRERLGLAADKYAALEERVLELEQENKRVATLEIENAQLRAQLKKPTSGVALDEKLKKTLKYFCDRNEVLRVAEVSRYLRTTEGEAQYFCDELRSRQLIRFQQLSSDDPRWEAFDNNSGYEITAVGRKLCFEGLS